MRKQTMALTALLILAACGQSGQQAAQTTQAAPEDVISGRSASDWRVVRNGEFADGSFVLQQAGMATIRNPEVSVAAGDLYTGEVTIMAQNAASVIFRVTQGCGTLQNDEGRAVYDVTPGENTLLVHHKFTRQAECAQLSLTADAPLTYTLSSARLTRTP